MNDDSKKKTCSNCIWYIDFECANPRLYANVDVYNKISKERLEKYRFVPQDWFGCEFYCDVNEKDNVATR